MGSLILRCSRESSCAAQTPGLPLPMVTTDNACRSGLSLRIFGNTPNCKRTKLGITYERRGKKEARTGMTYLFRGLEGCHIVFILSAFNILEYLNRPLPTIRHRTMRHSSSSCAPLSLVSSTLLSLFFPVPFSCSAPMHYISCVCMHRCYCVYVSCSRASLFRCLRSCCVPVPVC